MIEACFCAIEPLLGTKTACAAVGRPRATHYRRAKPGRVTPRKPRPAPANKLTDAEVNAVLTQLRSERFVDHSPDQVYFTLLDEGIYIASVSSFYRILRANAEVRERRRQATHPAKVKPELVANTPLVVWSSDITKLNDEIKRYQAEKASRVEPAKATASEQRANEVDHLQAKALDAELSEAEREQLDASLRGLAVTLRREGETDEQAFERVKSSKYLIDFKHDEYWPFYHVDHKFGRIILTINTAHAFFDQLYSPLRELARKAAPEELEDGARAEPKLIDERPLIALELLLLSLARAQSVLAVRDEEAGRVFDRLRREWSEVYRINLAA